MAIKAKNIRKAVAGSNPETFHERFDIDLGVDEAREIVPEQGRESHILQCLGGGGGL